MMKNTLKLLGIIAFIAIIGFSFVACNTTPEIKNYTENGTWTAGVEESSKATIQHSVDNDDVCTITIGGIAETAGNEYFAGAEYSFLDQYVNATFTHIFEAWTSSGTRTINVYSYASGGPGDPFTPIEITTARKKYTVVSQKHPSVGQRLIFGDLAGQLGTFYIKMISITEN